MPNIFLIIAVPLVGVILGAGLGITIWISIAKEYLKKGKLWK